MDPGIGAPNLPAIRPGQLGDPDHLINGQIGLIRLEPVQGKLVMLGVDRNR
jgi:hypothetical protein